MPPTTNETLDEDEEQDCIANLTAESDDRDQDCIGITTERKYYHLPQNKTFIKRSLRPREYKTNIRGQTIIPRLGHERLRNEAAALQFIKSQTSIPVPEVKAAFEDDNAFYLVTQYVEGVGMNELNDEQKTVVMEEIDKHLQTLHSLRSPKLGGPTGLIIPPYRAWIETSRDDWNIPDAQSDVYVFCHNDLSQNNILVDPDTLKITAILDWECAGFYPAEFEKRIFERPGHSCAMEDEVDDSDAIVSFFVQRHQS